MHCYEIYFFDWNARIKNAYGNYDRLNYNWNFYSRYIMGATEYFNYEISNKIRDLVLAYTDKGFIYN